MAETARGVAALHAGGIVHGNVKPDNVLLCASGAKLSDPGLSHVFTPGVAVTGMGSVGSLEFADPELLHGEPAGGPSDVWSLGLLLHRVAAGTGVYGELPAMDGLRALRRILSSRPEISTNLEVGLAAVVHDCLAPAVRRPTAAAVADRITAVA